MIEKSFARKISSYDELSMNKKGDVIYNGSEINDFTAFVKKCLAGFRYA